MLEIDIESRKGILFVRLDGELCQNTIDKWNEDVKDLLIGAGIRNVVFNVSNLTRIDFKGINSLLYGYELCKNNHGKIVLCGINDEIREKIKKSRILKYINESDNELSALKLINI